MGKSQTKMTMPKNVALVLLLAFLLAAHTSFGFAFPTTVPAFLWSPHHPHESNEAVNYQTISPTDLANSVLSKGGWSNLLCSGNKHQRSVDLALVFIGRELLSSDISGSRHANPALVDLLKVSFTRSNFSMAFPYVAAPEEETMENLLVSGLAEGCGNDLEAKNVFFTESCSIEGGSFQRLPNLYSFIDHLASRKEQRTEGQADLVVFCSEGSNLLKEQEPQPESEIITELISMVDQSGAKYAALYVSDPYRYPSHHELQRFLAETAGNGSDNATSCDEVCQIKSSLLEGVLVGVVLLLILISGLCCMMGIDTPTRFETPQDS